MTRDPQRLADYLSHIIEAIERIQRYTGNMEAAQFLGDELVQDGVIRNLEVIGEASRNISRVHPNFAAAHPELPLAIAYDMRNTLAHGYFNVDLEIVWQTVRRELPALHALAMQLRGELAPTPPPA